MLAILECVTNYFLTPIDPNRAKVLISHLLLFCVSIFIGLYVLNHPWFLQIVTVSLEVGFVSAFIAGLFFTSALTSPIGIAMFFILGETNNVLLLALIGALGSVLGDSLLLKYLGNSITEDIEIFTGPLKKRVKFLHFFKKRIFSLPLFLLATLIIASPLPDELGITLLASIKIRPAYFLVFSYSVNFLGILAISEIGSLWR